MDNYRIYRIECLCKFGKEYFNADYCEVPGM